MAEDEDSGADPTDGSPERTPPEIAGDDPPGTERAEEKGSVLVERARAPEGDGSSDAVAEPAASRQPSPYLVSFHSAFRILRR